MKDKRNLFLNESFLVFSILFGIFIGFLLLIWYVSDPVRAGRFDRYILYGIDDILRYASIRDSLNDVFIFFTPYLKFLYALIANLFFYAIPLGMSSLRIMNSLFSVGSLFLLYRLTKLLGFEKRLGMLAVFITVIFPIYFLLSISTHAEPMFTFFLLASLYFLCQQRYGAFSFLIALMPLLRLEGLLYVELAAFILLFKKPKVKYFLMLILPALLWLVLNRLFWKMGFLEVLGYNLGYLPRPPQDSIIFLSQVNFMYYIGFYPMLFLSLVGIARKIFDKKYFFILAYISVQLIFMVFVYAIDYYITGGLHREFRHLMPVIPLLAIFEAVAIEWMLKKFAKNKTVTLGISGLIFAVLCVFSSLQFKQFQKDPELIGDGFSYEQDRKLRLAASWLKEYLKDKDIKNIYTEGTWMMFAPIRKLWVYLPADIKLYCLYTRTGEVLDVLSWRILSGQSIKGLLVAMLPETKEPSVQPYHQKLIQAFADIPLYFYALD